MKNNWGKYIFIIFIIVIIVAVIYKENKNEEPQTQGTDKSSIIEEIVKEITLGVAEFDTMNPILSKNKHIQEISRIIYEPLLELDEQYKLQKCLAKDWAKTSNTTYLVKIRDDIKWSDGTPLLIEDVIFTIQTIKQVSSIYSTNVQNINSVEKIDTDTLQITLDQEIPFFEYNLIFPIINKANYEVQNATPIGSGKYKIVQNVSNAIILSKNEYYTKEELTLEKITISKYEKLSELYNAFKLGKIDVITTTNTSIEDYIGTIGYNKQEISGREFDFLALNTQHQVLSNPQIRKAILYGINRENIVKTLFNNKYKVTDYPLDYGSWLKGEGIDSSYNPELAKQILQENYGARTLSFKIVVQASNKTRISVAEMIKSDLEAIGIKVTIIKANNNQYNNYLKNKNYDSIITGTTLSLNPNLETYFNITNFSNEELNNLMSDVKNITNQDLLKEKYDQIRKIFNEQIPFIGLYNNYYSVASSWALIGNVSTNWYNIFIDINNWYKN